MPFTITRAIILCFHAFLFSVSNHLEWFLSVHITYVIYRINSFCMINMTHLRLVECLDLGVWVKLHHENAYTIWVLSGASLTFNILKLTWITFYTPWESLMPSPPFVRFSGTLFFYSHFWIQLYIFTQFSFAILPFCGWSFLCFIFALNPKRIQTLSSCIHAHKYSYIIHAYTCVSIHTSIHISVNFNYFYFLFIY